MDVTAWGACAEGAPEAGAPGAGWQQPRDEEAPRGCQRWISFQVSLFLEDSPGDWLHPEPEDPNLAETWQGPHSAPGFGRGSKAL